MSNPQIHQHNNPSKFNTDKFLLPSGNSIRGVRESGQALFVLLALIIAAVIGLVFGFFRPTALAIETDNKTWQALAQAKDVLIGYAVSHPLKPGLLPYPDRNSDTVPNYDGYSDCPPQDSNPVTNSLLLGKFPVIGEQAPCVSPRVLGMDKVDGNGERLWYAVSSNLVDDRIPGSTPNIPGNLIGINNWLTVRDANGTVLDNLVAFVVLSPGPALPGQNRSGPAPGAINFLDNFTVGGTTYSNWDVALGFISAEDTAKVPAGANQFNDRLLYVTRDQYRFAIAKRVVGEVKNRLKLFAPYPSPTADPAGQCLAPPPPPPPPPSYLPIDPATCGANTLTGLPSWFTSDWESYVQYTPTGPNTAVLTIFGNNFAVP